MRAYYYMSATMLSFYAADMLRALRHTLMPFSLIATLMPPLLMFFCLCRFHADDCRRFFFAAYERLFAPPWFDDATPLIFAFTPLLSLFIVDYASA